MPATCNFQPVTFSVHPEAPDLCRTGYSRNLTGEPMRTDFDSYHRARRKTRRHWVTDTVLWVCTERQLSGLEQFHRRIGGDWFTIELPDWQGITDTVASFASPLTRSPVNDRYEVTASLTVPNPDIIPDDQLDDWMLALIGVTDDTFGEPIYYWVNINWGVLWNTGITDSHFADPIHLFVQELWPTFWSPS